MSVKYLVVTFLLIPGVMTASRGTPSAFASCLGACPFPTSHTVAGGLSLRNGSPQARWSYRECHKTPPFFARKAHSDFTMSVTEAEFNSLNLRLLTLESNVVGLNSDNVKLKSDNVEFKSDNVKLKSDNVEFKSDNVKLKSSIVKLKSDNVKLKSDIVLLKFEVKPLSLDRGVLLASQALSIYRGSQPLADVQRRNIYETLVAKDQNYRATLATVFNKSELADQLELSKDFDSLQDYRNQYAHPSDPSLFQKEVHEMRAILGKYQDLEPKYATSYLVLKCFDALIMSSNNGRRWLKIHSAGCSNLSSGCCQAAKHNGTKARRTVKP